MKREAVQEERQRGGKPQKVRNVSITKIFIFKTFIGSFFKKNPFFSRDHSVTPFPLPSALTFNILN